jgi:hypothetical protein
MSKIAQITTSTPTRLQSYDSIIIRAELKAILSPLNPLRGSEGEEGLGFEDESYEFR